MPVFELFTKTAIIGYFGRDLHFPSQFGVPAVARTILNSTLFSGYTIGLWLGGRVVR